jgi:V/A-type H+/Na+-transporting ATPase subunit K
MKKFLVMLFIAFILMAVGTSVALFAAGEGSGSSTTSESGTITSGFGTSNLGKFIGAGIAIAGSTIGAGLGVGRIGSAAMGAISEKPETLGISLVFVALAEGIALWGFIVAFLILGSK